ncbi:uncharacterized protein ACN2A1_007714 [Glossina fuscipes fuscipes]
MCTTTMLVYKKYEESCNKRSTYIQLRKLNAINRLIFYEVIGKDVCKISYIRWFLQSSGKDAPNPQILSVHLTIEQLNCAELAITKEPSCPWKRFAHFGKLLPIFFILR